MKRQRMGRSQSKRMFTRNAGSSKRNYNTNPMRGGIRL